MIDLRRCGVESILDGPARVVADDPWRRSRALRSLAVWADRFTPVVGVDAPDGLLMDITGGAHLFGGEASMLAHVPAQFGGLGFTARAAIAPTACAARALARFAPGAMVIDEREIQSAIGPLPVEALGIDPEMAQAMTEVGITKIHELLVLPRSSIAARFGDPLLRRVDQATGRVPELIDPVRTVVPPSVERLFQGPCRCLEALGLACRQSIDELCASLTSRGLGWTDGRLTLQRSDIGPLDLPLLLSTASADPAHLWSLFRPRLERAQLGFGVEGIRITATRCGRLTQQQARWWGESAAAPHRDGAVDRLLDTLINRLGQDRVLRLQSCESHIPERTRRLVGITERRVESEGCGIDADRPTLLHEPPQPVEAVFSECDGRVSLLRWRGRAIVINTCIGPERIASGWWGRGGVSRDYFKVQAADGQWLWLYRDIVTGDWFMHGIWA
jgi:protein ImuB